MRGRKERASKGETEEERCLGSQKTTLSKEGFKDYQLRLLGNLRSCILSTSKGPLCVGILQVGVKVEVGGGEGAMKAFDEGGI